MSLTFPTNIETENGYRALVTNPEEGCFLFYLMAPGPYRTFQWYSPDFKRLTQSEKPDHVLDNIEAEVLMKFFQLTASDTTEAVNTTETDHSGNKK